MDTFFGQFLKSNPDYLSIRTQYRDFTRFMTVVRYDWGFAIETDYTDDDRITTLEVLISVDGFTATLISRERFGKAHDEMKSYPRDSQYPSGCTVRLRRLLIPQA